MLARKLAFEIVADRHPGFETGLTRNWDAYQQYSLGLDKFVLAQRSRGRDTQILFDYDKLEEAIELFRKATKIDPNFGWAHYYLGLAYEEYGQNLKAQDAFERSIAVSPGLAPARVALAYQLFYTSTGGGSGNTGAAGLWFDVIDDPSVGWQHRARAFAGLADIEFRSLPSYRGKFPDAHEATILSGYYLARRAARAHERNRPAIDAADGLGPAHAYALNLVGVVLESISFVDVNIDLVPWTCIRGKFEVGIISKSSYAAQAAAYYRRAIEADPRDPVIHCNLAYAMLSTGDATHMESIRDVAAVRRLTGDRIAIPATGDMASRTEALDRKLEEYQVAYETDKLDLVSRNRYAYTYYEIPARPARSRRGGGRSARNRSRGRGSHSGSDTPGHRSRSTRGRLLPLDAGRGTYRAATPRNGFADPRPARITICRLTVISGRRDSISPGLTCASHNRRRRATSTTARIS